MSELVFGVLPEVRIQEEADIEYYTTCESTLEAGFAMTITATRGTEMGILPLLIRKACHINIVATI